MNPATHDRILDILRGAPACTLPLRELHRRICLEAGIASPGLRELERELQRDGSVKVTRAASPVQLLAEEVGPALREEYAAALRAADIECDAEVSLPQELFEGTPLDRDWTTAALERSITALQRHHRSDRVLRERLREAEAEFAAMRTVLHSPLR